MWALRRPPKTRAAFKCMERDRCDPVRSVIRRLEKMRRRIFADSAAEGGTDLGTVAPVHPAPHTRGAFLSMDLLDAGVATNRAAIALEYQRELIGAEPHRVEPQRARADRGVSRGIFGMGWRNDEGCPRRIRFGLAGSIGIAGTDGSNRAPEHERVLRIPTGDQCIRHRSNANGLETSGGQ